MFSECELWFGNTTDYTLEFMDTKGYSKLRVVINTIDSDGLSDTRNTSTNNN